MLFDSISINTITRMKVYLKLKVLNKNKIVNETCLIAKNQI